MDIKQVRSSGRPKLKNAESTNVHVDLHSQTQRMVFYRLGEGNISKGIRMAADLLDAALKGWK